MGVNWLAREARGETNYIPLPEVRRRLGLADQTVDGLAADTSGT